MAVPVLSEPQQDLPDASQLRRFGKHHFNRILNAAVGSFLDSRVAPQQNPTGPETHAQIRRYFYAEHWKVGTIASELGLHADTVRSAIEARPRPQNQALARRFQSQGLPLDLIESALLLGSLRRMIRPAGSVPLAPIRSLAYFQPVIAEVQLQPLSEGYLDFLRLKFRKVSERIAG